MLWSSFSVWKKIIIKKRLFKDLLTPQMGFHLRSSTQETKDLPVSKRAHESFLAKRDIYAYRISGTAFPISATSTSTFPSSLAIRSLGVWVWPSEVRGRLFYTWTYSAHPAVGVPGDRFWPPGSNSFVTSKPPISRVHTCKRRSAGFTSGWAHKDNTWHGVLLFWNLRLLLVCKPCSVKKSKTRYQPQLQSERICWGWGITHRTIYQLLSHKWIFFLITRTCRS